MFAANEAGYSNLVRLVSHVYLDNPPARRVHLPVDVLDGQTEGMICLTGGERGPIGAALKVRSRRDCRGPARR